MFNLCRLSLAKGKIMALTLFVLMLLVSCVSLFFIVLVNKKVNRLLDDAGEIVIPKGKAKRKMTDFNDFDIEKYLNEMRDAEKRAKEEEQQKQDVQDAINAISNNPELLAAISKMV